MNRSKQGGFTLIELILTLGITAGMAGIALESKTADLDQAVARSVGADLASYNNAVRSWISNNPGASSSTKIGSAWLKSSSCPGGTSPVGYLPCGFSPAVSGNPINGGSLALSSVISTSGTAPNVVTTVSTTASPYKVGNKIRSDMAGLAALTAAASSTSGLPIPSGTNASFTSSPLTGVISMVASNNANNDTWLRTDGSNTMNATIRFGSATPASSRWINGASRIQAFAGEYLFLGPMGGATQAIPSMIRIDGDTEAQGTVFIRNLKSTTTALQIDRGSITASNGGVYANGVVQGNASVRGPIFYDTDDLNYYANPSGTSRLNTVGTTGSITAAGVIQSNASVRAPIFYDSNNTGYYMDFAGSSRVNTIYSDVSQSYLSMRSPIYYDANDMGFYLDPASTSRLNVVRADGGVVTPTAQLTSVRGVGSVCSPNGLIAIDNTGAMVNCSSGVWKKPGGSISTSVVTCQGPNTKWSSSCTASCPATSKIVGGGCSNTTGATGSWFVSFSEPRGNGWYCQGSEDSSTKVYYKTMTGYAICAE